MISEVKFYKASNGRLFELKDNAEQYERALVYSKKSDLHLNVYRLSTKCREFKQEVLPQQHKLYLKAKQEYIELLSKKHNTKSFLTAACNLKLQKDKLSELIKDYYSTRKELRKLRANLRAFAHVQTDFAFNLGKVLETPKTAF